MSPSAAAHPLRARALAAALALPLLACPDGERCEEDIRAQVLTPVEITVAGEALLAEIADEASERDRGWKHRRCDREALLLLPDAPGAELPVWGCALTEAIDVYAIRDGQILSITPLAPCPEPCGACLIYGAGVAVDAMLETPAGAQAWVVGDAVSW